MSEQATEGQEAQEPELIELPPSGDAAFTSLMDALAPEPENVAPAGDGGQEKGGAAEGGAAAAGQAAAGSGEAAAPATPATPTAGDPVPGGAEAPGGEGAAAGGTEQPAGEAGAGDRPASWTAPASDLIPKLGEISTQLEQRTIQAYQTTALEEVKEEYGRYFQELEKHPRLLVGTEVPAIGKDGVEVLRDTDDAKEWQDAVKSILVDEVKDRASRALEENRDFLDTVHASIELFQNNADLVPGSKDFDVELANRFATLVKPYEARVENKLQGYTIPVQPIINQLRDQLVAERAAQSAAGTAPPSDAASGSAGKGSAGSPGSGASTPPESGSAPTPGEPPQAGIPSKAGNSGDVEDFSTLFGTIGLPNLQI